MIEKTLERPTISLWQKIFIKVRHGMILQVIINRIRKIGIDFSPYIWFEEGINNGEMLEIKGMDKDYSFEILGPEDMKMIAKGTTGYSEEELLGFLKEDNLCLGIMHRGEVAASMWIDFKKFNYKKTTIPLKSNEVYLWNMYTAEAYRGKNLAPYLRYRSYGILREMNRDKLYSISDAFNTPALRFKKKLKGVQRKKLILYIELFHKVHWEITLKKY
jgi:hypothetical protein